MKNERASKFMAHVKEQRTLVRYRKSVRLRRYQIIILARISMPIGFKYQHNHKY